MPGDAFPPRPCCAHAWMSDGAEHARDCTRMAVDPREVAERAESLRAGLERRLDDAVHVETTRALREGAGEPMAVTVPGPAPGVVGSFLGGERVRSSTTMRTPRWAVHRFPTVWDSASSTDGAVDGRAVIPLGARVVEVAHDTRTGHGLMLTVLADSDPGEHGRAVPRVGAWQALALRMTVIDGAWASPSPSHGPPHLLAVVEGSPVFCVETRTLTALDDVDGIRRAAGHDL